MTTFIALKFLQIPMTCHGYVMMANVRVFVLTYSYKFYILGEYCLSIYTGRINLFFGE